MPIRHAVKEDLDTLARIEAASYPPEEGATREQLEGRIAAFGERFWILEEDDAVKGFVNGFVTPEENLTDEMYADPGMHTPEAPWQMIFSVVTDVPYLRQGVATRIMERVVADCRAEGKKGIVLTCKERLIPFYARFGFVDEGVSSSEHGGVVWHQMRLRY